jgi:hypothetical protein
VFIPAKNNLFAVKLEPVQPATLSKLLNSITIEITLTPSRDWHPDDPNEKSLIGTQSKEIYAQAQTTNN